MEHIFHFPMSWLAHSLVGLLFMYVSAQTIRYGLISFLNYDFMNPETNPLLSYDRDELESE